MTQSLGLDETADVSPAASRRVPESDIFESWSHNKAFIIKIRRRERKKKDSLNLKMKKKKIAFKYVTLEGNARGAKSTTPELRVVL